IYIFISLVYCLYIASYNLMFLNPYLFPILISHSLRSTLFPYTTLFRSHDFHALDIARDVDGGQVKRIKRGGHRQRFLLRTAARRSEEHTSELQSRFDIVCRLLLEKKK